LFLFYVSNEGRRWAEEAAVEEASQAWAETEAVFVGGRRLSGVSNGRRKWAQAEEVSIGPRAEEINGGRDTG